MEANSMHVGLKVTENEQQREDNSRGLEPDLGNVKNTKKGSSRRERTACMLA